MVQLGEINKPRLIYYSDRAIWKYLVNWDSQRLLGKFLFDILLWVIANIYEALLSVGVK
jgi:hypothetical protein